jgi:hypothetical protein
MEGNVFRNMGFEGEASELGANQIIQQESARETLKFQRQARGMKRRYLRCGHTLRDKKRAVSEGHQQAPAEPDCEILPHKPASESLVPKYQLRRQVRHSSRQPDTRVGTRQPRLLTQ